MWFGGVVGYHICLTHRRSPVRSRAESSFFLFLLLLFSHSSRLLLSFSFRVRVLCGFHTVFIFPLFLFSLFFVCVICPKQRDKVTFRCNKNNHGGAVCGSTFQERKSRVHRALVQGSESQHRKRGEMAVVDCCGDEGEEGGFF